jgi:uncharacterized phage protein gp47/JayE
MSITVKTFDQMVDDILDRIIAANIGFTDKSKSSVLRTIVESIVSELDIQYYQLDYVYDSIFIDSATGDDLDRLIAVLSVYREIATYCTGVVTFGRSTPVLYDIPIRKGTIISTKSNINDIVYEFIIDNDTVLPSGSTSVNVNVTARDAGYISVAQHQVIIMNNPIIDIDTVDNIYQIEGGSDKETDVALRVRAKLELRKLGKASNDALQGAILDITGVESVTILDMHRGVGTSDAIIQCTMNPVPVELQTEIANVIALTKASGIDVLTLYPTVVNVNISVNIDLSDGNSNIVAARKATGKAIQDYIVSLNVGNPLVIKQMENKITSINGIFDMTTLLPTANTSCGDTEIIRCGTITINGEVWIDE